MEPISKTNTLYNFLQVDPQQGSFKVKIPQMAVLGTMEGDIKAG
jgi:hypothetical protein